MENSSLRYTRQIMLAEIGESGQEALARARVLIVGVGGLGSPVALYLAGAGVGHLGIIDNDVVSESNLHRQVVYDSGHVGQSKAKVAAERLANLNPDCQIVAYECMLDAENAADIIGGYDLVVDCCDNYATRYLIDDVCGALKKTWIHGSIGQFCGQVTVFSPDSRCRYADLYPERDELCALPRRAEGVIGPVPGVIGSIQACEAIKLIVGIPSALVDSLFSIDLKTMQTNLIEL